MQAGIKSINAPNQSNGPEHGDFSGSGILGAIQPHLRNLVVWVVGRWRKLLTLSSGVLSLSSRTK